MSGRRIADAVAFVAAHPGCAMLPVARAVGPNGSTRYGYRTVHRAVAAGYLCAMRIGGKYRLYLPPTVGGRASQAVALLSR